MTIKVFWGDFGPVFYVSEQISMWKYVLSLLPSQGIYGFDRGFGKGGGTFFRGLPIEALKKMLLAFDFCP